MELEKKESQALGGLVSEDSIREWMPEWDDMEAADKDFLRAKMLDTMHSRSKIGMSTLEMGQTLLEIRNYMEKKGLRIFTKFVKGLNFTKASAYYYIENYERVTEKLPPACVRGAMAMGLKINGTYERPLGKYTDAVKKLIPPKKDDPTIVRTFWEDAEKIRRRVEARTINHEVEPDHEEMVRKAYHSLTSTLRKVKGAKRKMNLLDSVIGFTLADLGVSSRSFTAETPSEDMKLQPVGRPRTRKEEEAA